MASTTDNLEESSMVVEDVTTVETVVKQTSKKIKQKIDEAVSTIDEVITTISQDVERVGEEIVQLVEHPDFPSSDTRIKRADGLTPQ